jgi:tyrosyl-tRNA synthetase
MESKKALARELVARFYDQAEAEKAEEEFVHQFKQKEVPDDIQTVRIVSVEPVWICRLLAEAGLVASNGEARRLIQQGGVKLNGEKVAEPDQEILPSGELVLQAGKRRFARVVFSEN